LRNRRLILRLYYFQGTHILGASRGGPCVSVASCSCSLLYSVTKTAHFSLAIIVNFCQNL